MKSSRRLVSTSLILLMVLLIMLFNSLLPTPSIGSPLTQSTATPAYSIFLPIVMRQCQSLLNYNIGTGVPAKDVDIIKSGICLAQSNIQSHFGGDIPTNIKPSITVKIVATGLGNQEPGGGGACCTALNESGARLFFDVLHSHWINGPPDPYPLTNHHLVTAAHEYTHAWQWSLGCLTIHNQPLGDWLNEGIAHYVGHDSLIRNGYMTTDGVRSFQLDSAIYAGEADVPLESLEGPGSPLWPGHIGYLAVEKLVSESPLGLLSLRTVCEQIKGGLSVNQAFQNAFGVTKSNFYATFPAYIDSLRGTSTP